MCIYVSQNTIHRRKTNNTTFLKHIYSRMFSVVFLCKTVLRVNIIYWPLLCFNIVSVVQQTNVMTNCGNTCFILHSCNFIEKFILHMTLRLRYCSDMSIFCCTQQLQEVCVMAMRTSYVNLRISRKIYERESQCLERSEGTKIWRNQLLHTALVEHV